MVFVYVSAYVHVYTMSSEHLCGLKRERSFESIPLRVESLNNEGNASNCCGSTAVTILCIFQLCDYASLFVICEWLDTGFDPVICPVIRMFGNCESIVCDL